MDLSSYPILNSVYLNAGDGRSCQRAKVSELHMESDPLYDSPCFFINSKSKKEESDQSDLKELIFIIDAKEFLFYNYLKFEMFELKIIILVEI